MTNETTTLRDRCYENEVRVERIVHLDVMTAADLDGDLTEWLAEDEATQRLLAEHCGVEWPDVPEHPDETPAFNRRNFIDELEQRFAQADASGWIVVVATPVRHPTSGANYSFSWGSYYSFAVYGQTYDEALERAFEWVAERATLDLAKEQDG